MYLLRKSLFCALPMLLANLLQQTVFCQSTLKTPAGFENDEAVFTQYRQAIVFGWQHDTIVATTHRQQDILLLNEKNANLFSRSSVFHSGYNELKDFEAYTLHADGKTTQKVTERKTANSESNAVFFDDVQETKFNFPALHKGATTVLRYSLFHKDAHLVAPLMFSAGLPATEVVFSAIAPETIHLKYRVINDPKGLLKLTIEKKDGLIKYNWLQKNVRNPTGYADAPDERYFLPHVVVYVASYIKEGKSEPFLNSVNDLYRWNRSFLSTVNVSKDAELQHITDSLVQNKTTALAKAAAIYQWVQNHIRYVAFENGLEGFRPRQASDIYRKRYGDCKDMCSIITEMLQMAGLQAFYTWIGTNDIPYKYSQVPLPIVDNHMISTLLINGRWFFLDGTSPYSTLQLPPASIQGKEALVAITKDSFAVITVPIAKPSINQSTDSTFLQFNNNGISGKTKVSYLGYSAEQILNALHYRDERSRKEYVKGKLSRGSNKYMLGEYQINTQPDTLNYIQMQANFDLPDFSKKVGTEYYINLNLFKILDNQTIDTAKRKVPKEFEFLHQTTLVHALEIPEGYKVSYLPPNYKSDNALMKYTIEYSQKQNYIYAKQEWIAKVTSILPSQFNNWNTVLTEVQKQYKELVVLEKIAL